jgi:uncharacterized protein (TIGR02679 family)
VSSVDLDRARALFDDGELGWIVDRLRARLEGGQQLEGRLRLADPTDAERDALERLLGRRPQQARSISVEVAELERTVVRAGIAPDLVRLVVALRGPIVDRAAAAADERQRWVAVHDGLRAEVGRIDPAMSGWVDDLERTGLVRRLAGDPTSAAALLEEVVHVLRDLPARGVRLSELAATTLGDSHALDDGRPAATLLLGAIEAWSGLPRRDRSAAERRALWARVGVLLDELSAPVLVLGLRPAGEGLLARTLRSHADAGEPCRVTLRQLVRHRPRWSPVGAVRACENPTVIAAVADQLGVGAPAMVCTDGQPSGAVQTLLRQLAEDGVRVRFHVDFDGGGIRIGNLLVDRFGAVPWRMSRDDYERAVAVGRGVPLQGTPAAAAWDPDLDTAMSARGLAVHEEALLDHLLEDLRGELGSQVMREHHER